MKRKTAAACCNPFSQPTDFGQSDQKNGQSPCRRSTTRSLHAADIAIRSVRHAPGGPRRARSEGLPAATASSLLIPRARQGLVIQARPRLGRWRFPKVLEDCIFADASRWRGIRGCKAMGSPTAHAPQPIEQSGRRRRHAMKNLPDVRKPEDCYPQRSCASPFIAQVEDLVPGCSGEVRLESFALESSLPKPEATTALTFRDSPTETLFDNRLHGSLLPLCQSPHFFVENVWYLYGRLHIPNHIMLYGKMSVIRHP